MGIAILRVMSRENCGCYRRCGHFVWRKEVVVDEVVVVVTVVESVQHRASGSAVAAVGNMRSFGGGRCLGTDRGGL